MHVHNVQPLLSPSILYACAHERVPVVATLHNFRLVCPSGTLYRDGAICQDCVGRLPAPAVQHGCCYGSRLGTAPVVLTGEIHRHAWRTLVSAYIHISEFHRQILAPADLPKDRLFVKYNLIPFVEPPPPRSSTGNTVIFAGRLDEAKGIRLLMEAWDLYSPASRPRTLRLVIAGTGPRAEEVEAWARNRADVEVAGLLTPASCHQLMTSARAVVAPAQWFESFGLTVVEAMAAGAAIIAPAQGAFPELIVDKEEGRLFPPADARSLAQIFQDAECAPDRYARYGMNARRAYESRFHPDDNIKQLVSIYEYAINNPVRADRDQQPSRNMATNADDDGAGRPHARVTGA